MSINWTLTVADVLKRPLFQHAEVVAGRGGLNRSIRWVHVLESADNHKFLNGGELILSTGLGFGSDSQKRLAYLKGVVERGAVGVCIELGEHIQQIPQDMCELADHYQFPLIAFLQPVRFVDITLDLHELLVNRHTEMLRTLASFTRHVQQLSLQQNGLTRILERLQETVQLQTIYYPLEGEVLFTPAMPQSVQRELSQLLQEAVLTEQMSPHTNGLLGISAKKQIAYQPIAAMGHVLAYLGIVLYERPADEFLLLALDYAAAAIAQILLRKMVAEEQARDRQDRLLDQLLAGESLSDAQLRLLLGIAPKEALPPYRAVILELGTEHPVVSADGSLLFSDLLGVVRFVLRRNGFAPLLRSRGQRLYMLLLLEQTERHRDQLNKAMSEISQLIRNELERDEPLRWGISRLGTHYDTAKRHFQEAEQALANQSWAGSPYYEDLGVYRLLVAPPDTDGLRSFVDDYLGPLLCYDQQHNSQLLTTLRVFLDQQANKQEAAEKLFIRRQTLYHRLEKIKELLGDSYLQPEHRLCLELALRIYERLNG